MSDNNSTAVQHVGLITRLSQDTEAMLVSAKTKFDAECASIRSELEAAVVAAEAFGLRIERDVTGAVSAIWQKIT
jgi:hypothetical protein